MKKQKKSEEKKKNRKNNKTIIYVIIAIITIVALYLLYSLVIKATDIYTLEESTLYFEESSIGYIIRNEVVVQGENYKNGMIEIASEGERVSKEQEIFRYYSNTEEEVTKKIEELNLELQEAISNEKVLLSTNIKYTDIKYIEDTIDEKSEKLSTLTDLQEIEEYKKEINNLISKRAQIVGEDSKSGSYIKQLMKQKEEYEKELSKNSEYMKSPIAGTVSYRVDGLESVLTPNCFDALTEKYLNSLDFKTGKIIASSKENGKVVDNFYCYIATVMNSQKAKEAEVGDKVKLRILGDEEVSAQIEYINKEDENNIIVVFKINKMIDKLVNYRKIDFDVIWWSYSGLKVPNQAILTDGKGLKYVIKNRSGYLTKMLIKVKRSNETHSIIEAYDLDELKEIGYEDITNYKKITLYDEIVLNPTWDMLEE